MADVARVRCRPLDEQLALEAGVWRALSLRPPLSLLRGVTRSAGVPIATEDSAAQSPPTRPPAAQRASVGDGVPRHPPPAEALAEPDSSGRIQRWSNPSCSRADQSKPIWRSSFWRQWFLRESLLHQKQINPNQNCGLALIGERNLTIIGLRYRSL
jgi:hypothetical protein